MKNEKINEAIREVIDLIATVELRPEEEMILAVEVLGILTVETVPDDLLQRAVRAVQAEYENLVEMLRNHRRALGVGPRDHLQATRPE